MKLLKVAPRFWFGSGCANSPGWDLTIDGKLPNVGNWRFFPNEYNQGIGAGLYLSEPFGGRVQWHYHNPHDEHGYGGQRFVFAMADGTTREVRGPWSSRAGVVNKYLKDMPEDAHVLDVAIYETGPDAAGCGLATGCTLDWLRSELSRIAVEVGKYEYWWLCRVTELRDQWGETTYEPVLIRRGSGGEVQAEMKIDTHYPERREILYPLPL